jgi:pimeloyl-ACP methyl ester carboxylesterase
MEEHPVERRTFHYSAAIRINYEVAGHGGIPVVFLHGFAASLSTWHDISGLFPPESFRLYFLDLKGFGFSAKPRDGRYTPEDQAAVVTAFIEAEGLRQIVLIGHSLGGGIALLVYFQSQAEQHGPVDRLVLIASAAYPQRLPLIMRLLRYRPLGWSILHLLPLRFMVRYTLEHIMFNREAITPPRIERYLGCFSPRGIAYVFIETCRRLIPEKYANLAASIRGITVPTLLIWGKEDRVIPTGYAERLHSDIPGSRLVLIDDCGHIPHEERPQETWSAIRDFLEKPGLETCDS